MEYFDPHSHTQALSEKGTAKSDTGGRGEYVGLMEYSTYQNPTGAKSKTTFFPGEGQQGLAAFRTLHLWVIPEVLWLLTSWS